MDNDNNLNELLNMAMNDNDVDNKEVDNNTDVENVDDEMVNTDFGGTFHEHDSLTENNIVDKVSKSFLQFYECYYFKSIA